MKKLGIIVITLIGALMIQSNESFATHTAGMDMFYRHTTDSSYEFTLIFYRNCQGFTAGAPGSVTIQGRAPSVSGVSNFTAGGLPTGGTGVPSLQPANMYNCTDATTLCYEEYVYRGTWTSPRRATDWKFSYQLCCRPNTNAPTNTQNGTQYVECGLNNFDFPDWKAKNWSPLWHNRRPNHPGYTTDTIINFLFRTVCAGNFYTVDLATREYQGDSVSYGFYWPQTAGGAPINYINGYCFTGCVQGQMPTQNGPLTINPVTGIIPLVPGQPTGTGIYVLGIEAIEWRYDTIVSGQAFAVVAKQIGYIRRDMTVWIDAAATCREDSVHPKSVNLNNGGGDTTLNVFFHTGNSGDPNSRVRCNTISPDGSEFRVLDSTNYVAPYDSTVRSIGVHRATWTCKQGNTDRITLYLAEPLKCQKYTIMLKTGTDLDVLESECGFLEPEFTVGEVTVRKNVQVDIDTSLTGNPTPSLLSYCLPMDEPFPKLYGTSKDSSSFPLEYYWTYKCPTCVDYDTIDGQDTPFMWAQQEGWYEIRVRDPLNCTGDENIRVVYDTYPSFKFELDPYCDKYGEPAGLPDVIWAPEDSTITNWQWWTSLGQLGQGDTLKSPNLIDDEWYQLIGTKDPKIPGAKRCSYTYEFKYSRDSFPPQDPLWVEFLEDEIGLCETEGDTGWLQVWIDGVRDKYPPLTWQWYRDSNKISGIYDTIMVKEEGNYSIFMRDSLGCWDRDTAYVYHDTRLDGPIIPCQVRGGTGTFTFMWEEPEKVEINWVSLDGGVTWQQASNGSSHSINNVEQQKFIQGKGETEGACLYTEISTSRECPDQVFPPNVITPNGDGLNDVFNIPGLDLFENSRMKVYDRWGNIVLESDNYKNDWNGGDLPEGTYYYVLKVDDPKGTIHKGVLTILR